MFGFKSKLINATLAASFAIPLATAGMFTSAGSAQAAALTGSFHYNPYDNPSTDNLTTVNFSKSALTFLPDPGAVALSLQQGDFTAFKKAYIYGFNTNPFSGPVKFLDLGTTLNLPEPNGKDVLKLTSFGNASFSDQANGKATDVNITFQGFFEAADGSLSSADGYITLAILGGKNIVEKNYNDGLLQAASFTGLAATSVPEPTTILGLGAVGAVMAMSRRRKTQVTS
ncbi:hypothetical protein BV372_21195 [Nostoc sp. T09]|uniref:PEP-CTERM sorting domain-containing protein n=1 Tax=Nostoc sp. T09 TaxID=1932621 RepID=UPI000A35ECE4|nr:PEP-CTERM sorting domain-containing protein [Nostoc sp. T09]OUL30639.1 hypothetical protein BV372_21195 [Nostoc sp. T09]